MFQTDLDEFGCPENFKGAIEVIAMSYLMMGGRPSLTLSIATVVIGHAKSRGNEKKKHCHWCRRV